MFLPSPKTKKFFAGFLLLIICLGIAISVFWSVPKVLADSDVNVKTVVDENKAQKKKDSGEGGGEAGPIVRLALSAANAINYAIAYLAAGIISIEAGILNYILNPKNFPMTQAPVVKTGWDITRLTVNMFFVLVLLVVAFATILRIETYSLKAILPRLIIVALLINFSLVIAGAIIDFSNVLTHYFLSQITKGGYWDTAGRLINGLNLSKFFQPEVKFNQGFLEAAYTTLTTPFAVFASILVSVLFLIATVFIFALLIVMMLIRVIYLWILLILAPAAWFFYIIPAWQSQWYKWWSKFFQWTFFAPIVVFFIYLSITTLETTNKDLNFAKLKEEGTRTTVEKFNLIADPIASFFQFFVGTGLILGSIIAAKSMSITGAGIATSLGTKMGRGIAGAAGRYAKRKTQPFASRLAGRIGDAMDKSKLFQYRGLRQLSRPFQHFAEAGRDYEKQLAEQYKNKSTEYLTSLYPKADAATKRAIESILKERGELNKILTDPLKIEQAIKGAYKAGNKNLAASIIKFDPTSVDRISLELLKEIMGGTFNNVNDVIKNLRPKDWVNMNKNSFRQLSDKLLENASGTHISQLAQEGELTKLKDIEEATTKFTKSELLAKKPTLVNYLDSQAGQSILTPKYKEEKKEEPPFTTS